MLRAGFTPGALEGAGTPFNWPEAIGYGRQPYASFTAGQNQCVAGPNGVAMGIFGWVSPAPPPAPAPVSNLKPESGGLLVFVLPTFNAWNWQRCFPQRSAPPVGNQLILRAGLEVVVAVAGDFYTRFPLGAQAGSQVWTDPATGIPYTANLTGGYVPTPWTVMQNGDCNARCRITSFVRPFN